ncbi:MAG: ammonium transporter, partial [Clostridium sp.]
GTYGDGLNGVAGGVTGLFYGDPGQLASQLIAVLVVIVFGIGSQLLFWKITDKTIGIRVKAEEEIEGLDTQEMGAAAYPEFEYKKL